MRGGKSAVGVGRGVGGQARALTAARCVLSLAAEAGTTRSAERPESGHPENIRGVAKGRTGSLRLTWSSVRAPRLLYPSSTGGHVGCVSSSAVGSSAAVSRGVLVCSQ